VIRVLDGLALVLAALVVSDLLLWWWRPDEVFLVLLFVVAVRALLRPYSLPAWSPARVVAAGVAAYAVLFSFITVTRHWAFRTHALDLGYYVQELWSMSQGRGPYVSLPEMHGWGDHFSPTLYLLVPLFALFPGSVVLLIAQSVAFSLGAIPLFALARRRLGSDPPAAAFALLYLLSPTLHGINIRDFHIAAFAIPLLLWAVYCFESGRMGWFVAAVILTLGCREDAALAVMGLGLWIALARRRWLWGLGLAAGSLALLFFDIRVLMPYFRGEPYPHLHRYAYLGKSLGEILLNMVLHPLRTLGFMVSLEKLRYLLALLSPMGFLPLVAPWELIPALPTLAHNLVSRDPVLFSHRTQYNSFVLPFLVLAAVSGYARLSPRLSLAGRPARGLVLGLAFLVSLALTSPTLNDLAVKRWWAGERQRAAYTVLARVPPAASVSAWDRFVAHLATRPKVFVFPVGIEQSEYVLLDATTVPGRDSNLGLDRRGKEVTLRMPGRDGPAEYRYEVVHEAEGYLLLRRSRS
jgi:uncharacterized membrane protein